MQVPEESGKDGAGLVHGVIVVPIRPLIGSGAILIDHVGLKVIHHPHGTLCIVTLLGAPAHLI